MQRRFSSINRRLIAWLLAAFLMHAQSVMGVSMSAAVHSSTHAGMQLSLADHVSAATIHGESVEEDASSMTAPCPMKSRMQNDTAGGCSGCSACCGAVISQGWRPITRVHEFIPALLVSAPPAIHTSPPFHPPEHN